MRGLPVFRLLRYFSIASLIAIVAATVTLALVYERLAVRDLVEQEQQHHVVLTRMAANILWPQFAPLVGRPGAAHHDTPGAPAELGKLHRAVAQKLAGTRVLKIKVYDLAGRTVFSTETAQIGEDKSGNAGFAAARDGRPASELTHRNQFSAFEQTVENVDVLSSYVPIYGDGSKRIDAVFEIYSDISALLGRIRDTRQTIVLWVSAVLLALYGALFFIVKHADGVIKRQAAREREGARRLREAHDQIDRSEQFHRSLIEHSFDAVLILDPDLRVRHATPSVQRLTGRAEASLIRRPLADCMEEQERERIGSWLTQVVSNPHDSGTIELARRGPAGGVVYLEAVATNKLAHPAIRGIVINMRDITMRKIAEMEARRLALYDSLTGLANRELFMQQLRVEVANTVRRGDVSAVLFIDLDGFKRVNDTLGHAAGDELLKEVAARIRTAVRAGDVIGRERSGEPVENIARFGGDEFTVVLPGLRRPEDATVVTRRLLDLIAQPYALGGGQVLVTGSIGLAVCPRDGRRVEDLLRNADTAMYHAKKQGKNTFHFSSG